MLDSENQKQSFIDTFEHRCSRKFRKFHRKISVLESYKDAELQLY